MILEDILKDKRNFFCTCFHVLLGAVCAFTPFALIGWFYFVFLLNFGKAVRSLRNNNVYFYLIFFFYLISFELLDRMAKTSPFLPYELGKYLLVLMGLIGLLKMGLRNKTGLILVFVSTPAIFYDESNRVVFFDIINNFFAPLSIGLCLAFIHKQAITRTQMNQMLKLLWLTCLSALIFTIIRTPELSEIEFSLKAQFGTTGGHSSNQVSTVLGLGIFLSFFSIYEKCRFSGYYWLDVFIMIVFTFQGLLSFSRGGILVAAVAIIILLFTQIKKNFSKSFMLIGLAAGLLFGTFSLTNSLTDGALLLRYQGETQGTISGHREKSLDLLVSGRLSIFDGDINLWMNHPIFGVGCGASRYIRNTGENEEVVSAHIELSRLLAEHGIFGFVYFFILMFALLRAIKSNKVKSNGVLIAALCFIAIGTSFHAAMRTYVTPVIVVLCVLKIRTKANDEESAVYRSY